MRLSMVIAAFSIVLYAGVADAGQSKHQLKTQKIYTCKAKIEPKGLHGSAFKDEMQKCTINPDNYI